MIVAITSVKKWDAICRVLLIALLFGYVSATGHSNNEKKDRRRTKRFTSPVPSPTYRKPFPTRRPPTEWPTITTLPPKQTVRPPSHPNLSPTPNPMSPKAYVEDPYNEDPYHDDPNSLYEFLFLKPRAALVPPQSPTMNPSSGEPSSGPSLGPSLSPTTTPTATPIVTVRKCNNKYILYIYICIMSFLLLYN